jgi:hypothetical protein
MDEILGAVKIRDFMNYKAAYLFNEILGLTNCLKNNKLN